MANITDAIADLAITRSLLLERVANGMSQAVADQYTMILDDITNTIKTANDIKLKNMQVTIAELKARVQPDISFLEDDLTDLAKTEAAFTTESINAAVGTDIFSRVVKDSMLVSIAKTSLIEGATIGEWFKSLDSSMQTDLERAIRLGVTTGETNAELALRVNNVLGKGIEHAKSITRTAVSTVSNQVNKAVYDENDDVIKGYEHLSTLDNRTSLTCAPRDGALWDKNGKGLNEAGEAHKFRTPPLHFNCRSRLLPVLKSFRELGLDIDEIEPGTRSSMDGQVSSGTTFNEWLKGKSPQFQKDYLGAGRYELYKDGKITLSQLVNQQGRTLSLAELRGLSEATVKSVVPDIKFGYGGKFDGYVKDIRPEAKIVIDKLPKPKNLRMVDNDYEALYNDKLETIDSTDNFRTFTHEYGHFIDHKLGSRRYGLSASELSSEWLEDMRLYENEDKGSIALKILNAGYNKESGKGCDISDIFTSFRDDLFYTGISGHSPDYFRIAGNRESEAFANMFSSWANNENWDKMKEYFPSLTSKFEKIMEATKDGIAD